MAQEPTLSTRFVRVLLEGVERAGISRSHFSDAARFDLDRLQRVEERMPCAEFYALCELALDLVGDPALGLHAGESTSGRGATLVAHMMANAVSLRRALETLLHFQRLVSDEPWLRLEEDAHDARVLLATLDGLTPRGAQFMAELISASMFRMIRRFGGGALPRAVCFAYPAPAHRGEYTRIFGGVERFGQPFTGIVVDRSVMELCVQDVDEELNDALCAQAAERLARLAQPIGYGQRVRSYLLQQEAPTRLTMAAVARGLGLSVRSLRRQLALEGVSFTHIASEAFAMLAKRHLSVERRTIQETAYLLGYADSGAFHRAFKRWTGVTPAMVGARR